MFEKYLVEYCSPTLAALKTASLFTYPFEAERELFSGLQYWNDRMQTKGITLFLLQQQAHTALVYVCRLTGLRTDLEKKGVPQFLRQCGYKSIEPYDALLRLEIRLRKEEDFPHEIGLFLGYPLEDVSGFIEHAGAQYICAGFWKVYGNAQEAQRQFAKYRKCRDVYLRLWRQGRSVEQLTVAETMRKQF